MTSLAPADTYAEPTVGRLETSPGKRRSTPAGVGYTDAAGSEAAARGLALVPSTGPQLRVVKPRPCEPRFDDELADDGKGDGHSSAFGALALSFESGGSRERPQPRLRLVTDSPDPRAAARAWREDAAPPAKPWVGRLVQALAEVLAGDRSLTQLAPYLSPSVYAGLDESLGRDGAGRRCAEPVSAPLVRSLHMCQPRAGVAEVAAVVRRGQRMRAVALRLELREQRWRCVALQVG